MQALRKTSLAVPEVSPQNKDDLTQLLILRFQQMMSDGVLKPGTKLPAERELATHFKVARSSLRPALKVLEMMGVIQQRIGDGSYLNQDASAVLALPMQFLFLLDGTSIQELTELRILIEPALAGRAAETATAEDIALLKRSIKDMESSKTDRVRLISSDLSFHRVIFEASGNRLMGRIFHTIHRAMLNMMMVTSQLVDLDHTVGFHRPICTAIERRDSVQASKLMAEHMVDAAKLLEEAHRLENQRTLREHISAPKFAVHKTVALSRRARSGGPSKKATKSRRP